MESFDSQPFPAGSSSSQLNEHELIVEAQAGEVEAAGELCALHLRDLERQARGYVGCWADAEDVAQETCIQVCKHIGTFKDQGKGIRPYAGRIAKNLCVDKVRRAQRRPRVTDSEDQRDVAFATLSAPDNTEQQALDNLQPLSQPMLKALRQLEDDHQGQFEAVIAVYVEGKTYEEYSQESGVPMGTVRSRMHRGREKLKETYMQQQGGDINQ